MNRVHNAANTGRSRTAWAGYDIERWQWQPISTSHDPNPPITLEDAAVAGFNPGWAFGANAIIGVGNVT